MTAPNSTKRSIQYADCVYCLYAVPAAPDGFSPIQPESLQTRLLHSIYHKLLDASVRVQDEPAGPEQGED